METRNHSNSQKEDRAMIRNVAMVATLVAALGMPVAASASFMDRLSPACQAALLARRVALLHCNMDCSHRPTPEQQSQCNAPCLQRNAYRSAFLFSRPVCSEDPPPDNIPDCSSGMCTCKGATLIDAAESCINLVVQANCAS